MLAYATEFWKITHMGAFETLMFNELTTNFIVQIYLLMVVSHSQYLKLQKSS